MRNLGKLHGLAAVVAAAAVLATGIAGPALADPPKGVTPRATDAVGTGSDTMSYLLDQFSFDFNNSNPAAASLLYSFDATSPDNPNPGGTIVPKAGCAAIPRPDGSSAGLAALEANAQPSGNTTNYCLDYARSSRGRESTDPPFAPGGVTFAALAGDAVSWSDRDAASGGTDAPSNLTTAQLVSIYTCKVTNWDQVGGKNAPIKAFLPQTSSGTRESFLAALGDGTPITPGPCVQDGTKSNPDSLQENEGINPLLNSAEAIFIYSVGAFIAQAYHSAPCYNSKCLPKKSSWCTGPGCIVVSGPPCCPVGSGYNKYGCDETGVEQLGDTDGSNPVAGGPTSPVPGTRASKCPKCVINQKFPIQFQRTLYDVVRYDANTTDHIPGPETGAPGGINLEQFFSAASASVPGWACTNAKAATDIKNYGFLPVWKLSTCGAVS